MTISGGSVTLTTTDDGINVAGGNDGSGQQDPAGQPGAGQPGAGGPGGGGQDEFAVGDYSLTITGGTVVMDADGDGVDSNGTATMSGGTVVVSGPTEEMNGAIDVQGTFDISGGTLAAAGSAGMAQAPADGDQAVLGLRLGGTEPAGAVLQIVADDGTTVAVFESTKDFSSFVFSSPDLEPGQTYEVFVGGTVDAETTGGLASAGDLSGATSLGTATAS
ncbi:carbohydrate-binding domain-containing protein [Georgenia sp. TF02-10]|uniref:carbohydrate-binding domain-containing protein n=1 Tax=Georgenia sp. TF02-10 TaxID=2917725 RepID=UPI001FA7EEE4|nr:carbohydrate-binding domain-containing protein [Georgenia sp. TF02-10]UNX53539.1 carbohydrate-binding domain-containing protein [Georgenia sp. TF02-10]